MDEKKKKDVATVRNNGVTYNERGRTVDSTSRLEFRGKYEYGLQVDLCGMFSRFKTLGCKS